MDKIGQSSKRIMNLRVTAPRLESIFFQMLTKCSFIELCPKNDSVKPFLFWKAAGARFLGLTES